MAGKKPLKKGDAVAQDSPQRERHATVKRKLTRATQVKGHRVAASPENPEYLVKRAKSGKEAAH